MKSPIEGKKILLTRPEFQNADWAEMMKSLGAVPVVFPLIEISPVSDTNDIQKILSNLEQYDWIIFTSINAARYSLEIINKVLKFQHKVIIASIGIKTTSYLESHGIEVDFMPSVFTSSHLVKEMGAIKGKKILLPRTSFADEDLSEQLKNNGAIVREITVYHTHKVNDVSDMLQEVLNKGIDVITFASPSAVEAFSEMKIDQKNAKIAVIGPVTADKASKLRLKPDIIAENYTTEGLTEAIIKYYESTESKLKANQ